MALIFRDGLTRTRPMDTLDRTRGGCGRAPKLHNAWPQHLQPLRPPSDGDQSSLYPFSLSFSLPLLSLSLSPSPSFSQSTRPAHRAHVGPWGTQGVRTRPEHTWPNSLSLSLPFSLSQSMCRARACSLSLPFFSLSLPVLSLFLSLSPPSLSQAVVKERETERCLSVSLPLLSLFLSLSFSPTDPSLLEERDIGNDGIGGEEGGKEGWRHYIGGEEIRRTMMATVDDDGNGDGNDGR